MPADPVAPPSDGVFTVGRRGYDPQQVDAHLRRMDAEIRILVADRDAAVDQSGQLARELDEARLRADRLRTQVRTMAARPSDVQGMSERMRTMLRLAEDEVADMLRRADAEVNRRLGEADAAAGEVMAAAQREAEQIRAAARAQADETTAEAQRRLAETDAACAAERQAAAHERDTSARAIAEVTQRAEQERARMWAESEARRALVEEDFRLAMDQRRAEAFAELQAERGRTAEWVQRSREETTRQCRAELAAAEETAQRIVAAAHQRVAELADVRGRIAAQLHGTQAQLGSALMALAPGNEPPAAVVEPAPQPARIVAPEPPAAVTAPEPAPVLSAPEPPAALPAASDEGPDSSPTRPIPVTAPTSGTLVLDAPAVEPAPDRAEPAPNHEAHAGATAAAVPDQTGSDQARPDRAGPAQPPSLDAEARRADTRRRRRRSATGATRR